MSGMRELSHIIHPGMPVYPGDPDVAFATTATIEKDGVEVTSLQLSTHTGTHVDAPSHSILGGRTVAELALDELRGPGLVVHLPELAPGTEITLAVLEGAIGGRVPSVVPPIVVVDTGWARHYGSPLALEHPWLSPAAAGALLRAGMRVLGVDAFSPDRTTPGGTTFPVHDLVLGSDGVIVENLCNLDGLPPHVIIEIAPLPVRADGASARVVAFPAG